MSRAVLTYLPLDFFSSALITKEAFQSSKRYRCLFDALVNEGVQGGSEIGDRVQIFETHVHVSEDLHVSTGGPAALPG
jgi:hypothetical protein